MEEWIDEEEVVQTTPSDEWVDVEEDDGWVDETTGVSGAFGSSVDRIKGGLLQLIGDEEGANKSLQSSRSYVPTVASYKDIENVSDLGNYVGEMIAGGIPYAPAVLAGPKGLAAAGGLAATEAGAIYNEQEEKDVAGAVAAAGIGAVLDRVGFKSAGNVAQRFATEFAQEGARGATQHLSTMTVGYGKSFDEAMDSIDEAIMGTVLQRAATAPVQVAAERIKPFDAKMVGEDEASKIISQATLDMDAAVAGNYTKAERVKLKEDAWKSADEANIAQAARRMADYGAQLVPKSFDFLANEENVKNQISIGGRFERVADFLQAKYDIPFGLGDKLPANPREIAESNKNAYRIMKSEFDDSLGGFKPPSSVRNSINRYISYDGKGKKPGMSADAREFLWEHNLMHEAVQLKRARQISEASAVKGGQDFGTIGAIGETVVTGGVPLITTGLGVLSGASRFLSYGSRKRIEKLIMGEDVNSKPEEVRKLMIELIEAIGKGGVAFEEEEEIEGNAAFL